LADIEVIPSSARVQERYLDVVRSAKEEILWIFPTANAFIRQDKIGAISLAKEAAKEKNIRVRILIPASSLIEQKIQQLKQYCSPNNIIDIRYIVQMSDTKATILVVDRKASLVMELKDDSKATFIEAIGLSTYSNSKAGVLSYVAIFDNLWRQTELYEQVKDARDSLAQSNKQLEEANEQLETHDKMQKEFINIAAHELRTPIQPILGLTENLLSNTKDIRQVELLQVISRSAKRLQRLTEDILDVTKIESQSLNLKKEWFNLNDVIANIVDDALTSDASLKKEGSTPTVKLEYHVQNIFVQADKGRITQVISNLLSNALKFTKEGTISINLERKKEDDYHNDYVLISVKDTGQGINPEILPKLFTKFATKSETGGTGLGLFISKSIVETHGGKIRAENNSDGKGATFAFSLPTVNKE